MAERLGAQLQSGGLEQSIHSGLLSSGLFGGASLDLNFAVTKNIGPLVTFTRASSGTYVGSDRLIKTATTNLLLRSEEFDNVAWNPGVGTVTSNTGIAPNGTLTADTLTTLSGTVALFQAAACLASTTYTWSFYVKLGTMSAADFRFAVRDDSNGAFIATDIVPNITPVTTEWRRVVYTFTTPAGCILVRPYPYRFSPSTYGTTVHLWGAQLEQSDTVGEYIPTTSTINSAPRFDHNPTTGESLGLLVEEQRTNLLLRSEEFDNASWSKTLATVTANQTTAPDGTNTADKLIGNATLDGHYVQQNISGATSGISYTSSVFAKASELTSFELLHVVGSTLYVQGYDLSNGTLLTRVTPGTTAATGGFIQNFGNGWYRCGITQTSDGTTGAVRCTLRSVNTVAFDATSQGVFLWGAQLEAGAFPTSYIPTTTAAVTRSADVATDTTRGANIRSLYASFRSPASGTRPIVSLDDDTANERIELLTSGTDPKLLVTDGGSAVADLNGGTVTANVTARIAARFQSDDYAVSINGGASQLDSSGTLPTVNRIRIGSNQSGGYLNGTIAQIAGWDTALSNLPSITQ